MEGLRRVGIQNEKAEVVELPVERRKVTLDQADQNILKVVIFHAMNDQRSLQECLQEAFGPDHMSNSELHNLFMNAGLFDAACATARKQASKN